VPSAVTIAFTRLFAWTFTLHGIPVTGRVMVHDTSFTLRTDVSVRLYRGTGPGALDDDDVVLTGQTDPVRIPGSGDFTDGGPSDTLGEAADGRLSLYARDGKGGLLASRHPVRSASEVGHVLG
jgi:hypothetical protein